MTSPTLAHEDRLPRVPPSTLEGSCRRFVEWCAPLLTADELAATEAAVAEFQRPGGPGARLHAALGDDWLDAFWAERYLERRDPLPINTNFFFLFEDPDSGAGQVERAAALVGAGGDYKLRLDRQLVPPVTQRGQALSMGQARFLFATTRVPGPVRDTVRGPGPASPNHIVVFFRGNAFRMDVVGAAGRPFAPDDLAAALHSVVTAPTVRGPAVGHLTALGRTDWAASRAALLAGDPRNADALDAVETALFCLCLEDFAPRDALAACGHLLHGDSGNRWYDKALSLIVFADGTAGLNGEHSRLDGSTVVDFVDALTAPAAHPQGPPSVAPVEFVLDHALRTYVADAAAAFAARRADVASAVLSFPDFGADRAKDLGLSPDALVQLAFQLAHRRARGFVGSTYESIAMRGYRHGRTGAMRVVTPAVLRFVAAMEDPGADAAARCAALRAAAGKHRERARECQAGQGPEHHLSELLRVQRQRGAELGVPEPPALYRSPGWLTMREDLLSTSAAPSAGARYIGFGPTGARCIGIAYRLVPHRLDLYLSAPRPAERDLHRFVAELPEALRQLTDVLRA